MRFGFDHLCPHFLGAGAHLLLGGDGGGAADFGPRLRHALVGFGLLGLEFGADVVAHVDVGDVDGKDFKGGVAVETLGQHVLGDAVGIFEHLFIGIRRADGAHDPLAHAGDDGFLGRAAHEPVEMGANRDARLGFDADAVFGNAVDAGAAHGGVGAVDDLRVDAGLNGFQDGLAGALGGEVDGARPVEIEDDPGAVGHDEGQDHLGDVAAGLIMELQRFEVDVHACFDRHDPCVDHERDGDALQAHPDHIQEADVRPVGPGADPDPKEVKENHRQDQAANPEHNHQHEDDQRRIHALESKILLKIRKP